MTIKTIKTDEGTITLTDCGSGWVITECIPTGVIVGQSWFPSVAASAVIPALIGDREDAETPSAIAGACETYSADGRIRYTFDADGTPTKEIIHAYGPDITPTGLAPRSGVLGAA